MAVTRLSSDAGISAKIPKVLLETFQKDPRIIIKYRPDGIWPIDPGILIKSDIIQKLAKDKDFVANFDIIVSPKVR